MAKHRRPHILYVVAGAAIVLASAAALVLYAFEAQTPYSVTSAVEASLNDQDDTAASTTIRVPIIVYHSIQPNKPGETLMERRFDVTPDMLDQQLSYLQTQGYTVISLGALVKDLRAGTTSPVAKPVVLTFDDGWQDQYTQAFPLLKKYGDTATLYVYTNPIGKDSRFLTWSEIKEMDAAGMTIGSHTLSHPELTNLTGSELRDEIFNSKKVIEEHLGKPVTNFASPFGSTNPAIQTLVTEAGYTTGRTGYRGTYHSKQDLLELSAYYAPVDMQNFVWLVTRAP